MIKKFSTFSFLAAFLLSCVGPLHAEDAFYLPAPGTMVALSPAYQPVIVKGLTVHPENPFQFDFIIDTGNTNATQEELKAESTRLVKYFLASLTVPEKNLWVNLSPYEKDRIIPETLDVTAMGRDMLAEDYILKQLTASLIYPERSLGKTFWSKAYAMAKAKYGTTELAVNTFNKVWIIPKSATVYEHNGSAFVVDSHLTVMLDEDYLSLQKHLNSGRQMNKAVADVIREIIIPQIEKEVNTGRNFAGLRQIYNSMILAIWYKQNLKTALLNQIYSDQAKTKGIDLSDKTFKNRIYAQYLKAFKKGVYNYIKEDIDPVTHQSMPRKYFSGGVVGPENIVTLNNKAGLSPAQLSVLQDETGPNMRDVVVDLATVANVPPKSEASQARLAEIRSNSNQGFDVVGSDRNIPSELQQLLTFYDLEGGENPLRAIINAGQVRAGQDPKQIIDADKDSEGYLISTHEHNHAAEQLLLKLTPGLKSEFDKWQAQADKTNTGINQIAPFSAGIIVATVKAFKKYGILDLFEKEGTITVGQIISHIGTLPIEGYYHNPSREQIHQDLRIFTMLGWIKRDGNQSPDDNTKYAVTDIGREAFKYADLYGKVADFVPEFPRITDYMFGRENAPKLKPGVSSLRELLELSKNNWGLPKDMDPNLKWVIENQLNGYIYMNLLLAFYYEDPEFSQGDLDIDQLKRDLGNPEFQDENADVLEMLGITSAQVDQLTEETAVVGFNKFLRDFDPQNIKPEHRILLPKEMQDLLKKENLSYRNRIRINSAYLKEAYGDAIRKTRGGILNFFDSNSEISVDKIKRLKYIDGNTSELEAALDFFEHLGFLNKKGSVYKLTADGSFALYKSLMFGVTVSYRPMVDHTEEILFNSLTLGEDGVYRDLNVEGSGFTHLQYFNILTSFISNDIKEYLASGKIPSIRNLKRRKTGRSFVLQYGDMGIGDATFLSSLYHFILAKTEYGKWMQQYPEFYKLEMDGQDYFQTPQDISKARLDREGIPNIVMFGNVGKMVESRKAMIKAVVEKYPDSQILFNWTSTFLYHNRPGEDAPSGEELLSSGQFNSTGVYAWGDGLKSYAQFEDNLIRFDQSLVEPIPMPNRFVAEGRVYGIDLYTPFAAFIAAQIAQGRKMAILALPYAWHHAKSRQHMTEYVNARAALGAAGVRVVNFATFPPVSKEKPEIANGVNVGIFALESANRAMTTTPARTLSDPVDGGINFDPAMMSLHVQRDPHAPYQIFSKAELEAIKIDGLSVRIVKITDADVPALLGLGNGR